MSGIINNFSPEEIIQELCEKSSEEGVVHILTAAKGLDLVSSTFISNTAYMYGIDLEGYFNPNFVDNAKDLRFQQVFDLKSEAAKFRNMIDDLYDKDNVESTSKKLWKMCEEIQEKTRLVVDKLL